MMTKLTTQFSEKRLPNHTASAEFRGSGVHQVADLYQALKAFVERGELDPEEISEDDPAWDYMRGIDWAIDEALDFWLSTGKALTRTQAGDTIRAAARRGAINGASQSASGKWYFNRPKFRGWLQEKENHKPGPKADKV